MHLTDAELRDFASGVLPDSDLLRADDHLAACAQCQNRAGHLTGTSEAIRAFRADLTADTIHLAEEELQLAATGQLSGRAHEQAALHLKTCAICASDVEELRSWANAAPRSSVQITRLRFAAAAAIAILVPAGIWYAISGRQPRTESLAGLEQLPSPVREKVRQALQAGGVALPGFLSQIDSSREVQLGSKPGDRPAPKPEDPIATGILSDRPQFRWDAVADANAYVVSIFNQQSRLMARSPALTQTSWAPPAPLPRGQTYVWQVTAHRGKETLTAPAPPEPPAAFHIIDAETADVLRRTEAQHPDSHLLLGILYAEAGIRNAAITHLELVPPQDQHKDLARNTTKLLAALEQRGPAPH